jgi:exosome complex component RRP40
MIVLSSLVLPGQNLTDEITKQLDQVKHLIKIKEGRESEGHPVRLGFGIRYNLPTQEGKEEFFATVAGPLIFASPCRFWIGCRRKHYLPAVGDLVLGVVTVKTAEYYKLDLGCPQPATLNSVEGFSRTSRRNKAILHVGSVVFCRVIFCHKDIDPEVSCVEEGDQELGLGYIKHGPNTNLYYIPVSYSEDLQRPDNSALTILGKHFPFEIIVGCNGKFIIESEDPLLTYLLGLTIINSEFLSDNQIESAAGKILTQLKNKK